MNQLRSNSILLLAIFLFIANYGFAQEFQIPAEAKKRAAPFLFNTETQKTGETIYSLNCKSCHGDIGKSNYAKLVPIPKDPASPEYQKNSDGDIFYILTVGKGLMPQFSNTLSEEQRWDVISYIRSYNKEYKQPPIQQIAEANASTTMSITFYVDSIGKKISIIVADSATGNLQPVKDIKVSLYIKRTFGNLLVGEDRTSGIGVAQFDFPLDVPGDNQGNLIVIAKTGKIGQEISMESTFRIGKPITPKNILDQRAWWNVNAKAPIWLIMLYSGGLLIVLLTIVYILFQLKKIKDLNHKSTNQ